MRWIQAFNIFGENCKFRLTLTTTKFITKVYSLLDSSLRKSCPFIVTLRDFLEE